MGAPRFPLFDLSGQVALVTGSSRGIGLAIARHMALAGARVVISSRTQDACEEAARSIRAEGGEALPIACNIGHKDQLRALVDRTLDAWGKVDTLVCNAAVNPYYGPLSGIPDEAYDKTMNSNVRSTVWLCNMVLPQMAERAGGAAILVSSIAGLRGSAVVGVYGLSKAADMQLARNLAVEWGPRNVRVNTIAPGMIRTRLSRVRWAEPDDYARTLAAYPLGRIGEPDDVAGVAVMLAGPAGAFITGQTIVVDGGVTVAGG